MFSNLNWLHEAAHSATQLVCFGLWCAGCVFALRRRPRPGATLVAWGFGLLAQTELLSLVVYLAFVLRVRLGAPVVGFSDVAMLLIGGVTGISAIAGAALLVAGVRQAWLSRETENEPMLRPFDAAE